MTTVDLEDLDETQARHYLRELPDALQLEADRNAAALAVLLSKMLGG